MFHAAKESTVHAVAAAKTTVVRATHDATDVVTSLPGHIGSSDAPAADVRGGAQSATSAPGNREQPEAEPEPVEHVAATEGETKTPAFPDISFSPIAMPMLAGPGSMGVVIGVVAQHKGLGDSVGLSIGIAAIALLSMLTLLAATPINRWLGASGVMVLQRVFGFITLGIAVALVSTGISSLFGIPLVN